jgi:hypothetical protein
MLELVILALTIILLLYILNNDCLQKPKIITENFIDNIEGMEKTMKDLEEKEKETRMFCKLLRHKDTQDIDYVIENTNLKFKNELEQQSKTINDLKKKIINLKLDKVDSNFIEFNEQKNNKQKSFINRRRQIENAKKVLRQPKKVNLNINNNL